MLKKEEKGENLTGNDRYEGFCKDLAKKLADNMKIKCTYSFIPCCSLIFFSTPVTFLAD